MTKCFTLFWEIPVPETGSITQDVPANEETYQEARAYSAEQL